MNSWKVLKQPFEDEAEVFKPSYEPVSDTNLLNV